MVGWSRITHHLGCLTVHHTQEKPIGPDGGCRDYPYDYARNEQINCRTYIVEEECEEEISR
jgi:hypothetical protein